jgi:ABC-type multidrug transport system permease subunit
MKIFFISILALMIICLIIFGYIQLIVISPEWLKVILVALPVLLLFGGSVKALSEEDEGVIDE